MSSGELVLKIMKIANIVAGAFVALVGIWIIINLDFLRGGSEHLLISIFTAFLPFFYVMFGLLLVAAEFAKGFVNTYFSFLRHFLGRGLFNIFLATQTGYAGVKYDQLFAWILIVLGVIYIFLHFVQGYLVGGVKQKLLE